MKNLREISEIEGLTFIETTKGTNGYPQETKPALIGFKDWDHVEQIQKRYNLQTVELFKRDGQTLYNRANVGLISEPYEIGSDNYGDSYQEEDPELYEQQQLEDFLPFANLKTFEDLEKWLKEKREVLEAFDSVEEGQKVLTYEGKYYETINTISLEFHEDGQLQIIGLI